MGVIGQPHALAALPRVQNSGTYGIGGWVTRVAGLDGMETENSLFCVLLTVHLITIFDNNQLDAQLFFLYLFIPILYMFRAAKCPSSGESILYKRPLVCVTYIQ